MNPEILGVNIDELLSAPPAGKWCPFKELNKSDVKGYAHAAAPLHVSGSGRRRTYHLSDGQNHHFGSGDNAVHSRYPVEHRQHHPLGRSLSPAHLRCKKRCKQGLQRFHGTPGATRTHYIPLRSRPDTMKPSATQCKKILGNTRLFTVSNPIWYYAS